MPSKRPILISFWVTFAALGSYTLMGCALRYFEMKELVDAAVFESSQKRRVIATMLKPIDSRELADEVRSDILERARRSSLVLDDQRLVVTASGPGLTVAVSWAQPALAFAGQSILTFPMSLERSFEVPGAR